MPANQTLWNRWYNTDPVAVRLASGDDPKPATARKPDHYKRPYTAQL